MIARIDLSFEPSSSVATGRLSPWLKRTLSMVILLLALSTVLSLQYELDSRLDRTALKLEELAQLPRGQYLKPALLGYHHVSADVLWLRFIQVLGKKRNTANDYQWMYHALDVITTLDPQYAYAYQVGGIVLSELAHRIDLSNEILHKGLEANPQVWWLPFNIGYNYFFYLGDPGRAAGYIARAAKLPGSPDYLPGLATRMYAEAGNPDVALSFLEAMWRQTDNEVIKAELEKRMKELIIERDIRQLESAVAQYRERHGAYPNLPQDLIRSGILARIPEEPFGGEYRVDSKTGAVTSSSHPKRLHVYRPEELTKPSSL
ncbi:tetratricopeptide repeat protein [Candidatus Nitrospira bockiana]